MTGTARRRRRRPQAKDPVEAAHVRRQSSRRRPRAHAPCRAPPAALQRAEAHCASSAVATPSDAATRPPPSAQCWCARAPTPPSRAHSPIAQVPSRSHCANIGSRAQRPWARLPKSRDTLCIRSAARGSPSAQARREHAAALRSCAASSRDPRSPAHSPQDDSARHTPRISKAAPLRRTAAARSKT